MDIAYRNKKLAKIKSLFYKNSTQNYWFHIAFNNLNSSHRVLEIGSGSGLGEQNCVYPNAEITGIDIDPRVLNNPNLTSAYCVSAYDLSGHIEEQKFDVIYSHMVAEHIEHPEKFLVEQLLVLKSGGKIVHSTVSKYYWTSLVNNFVPEKIKNWLIATFGSGRQSKDIFKAYYRLNTKKDLERLCDNLGCSLKLHRQDEPPGYLRRSYVLMFLYTLVHKPICMIFPFIQPTLVIEIQKADDHVKVEHI